MPISVNISENGELVEILGSGSITSADIFASLDELYSSDAFGRMKYQLMDHSLVESYSFDGQFAEKSVRLDKDAFARKPDLRFAIVAPSDILFGSTRQWEIRVQSSPHHIRVFRERNKAESWLFNTQNKSETEAVSRLR